MVPSGAKNVNSKKKNPGVTSYRMKTTNEMKTWIDSFFNKRNYFLMLYYLIKNKDIQKTENNPYFTYKLAVTSHDSGFKLTKFLFLSTKTTEDIVK